MASRYQVVIVGGGPVGVALSVELGQRGISCAVVERHLATQQIPKGQNLSQRTLEHFYFWNCVDELRGARLLPPGYPIGGATAYHDLMSDYWYAPPGREVVRDYYFQANERLPQYLTEEVLRSRSTALPPVTHLFGHVAKAIEQDEAGVRVLVADETWPYEERVLEADYLVGCDGGRSLVRDSLGIERRGPDYDQKMVLMVFRSRQFHDGLARYPELTTYRVLDPRQRGVWQFFGRVDVGESWFFHGPVPREATRDNFDFKSMLERAAGFPFELEIDHVGFWELRIEVADRYREGRAFIAGDAAHSHPPYGAFGLNTGLEDVTNLGWKLAAAVEGWGGEALLDSYSEERQPIFVETAQLIIADGIDRDRQFLERYDPELDLVAFEDAWKEMTGEGGTRGYAGAGVTSYEPHYEGSRVVAGAPGSAISIRGNHTHAAAAGHHLSPQPLSSGRNVFEELGRGFTLLAFGAEDEVTDEFATAAEKSSVPLTIVRDSYEGPRRSYEHPLVLVRPDQYVVWTGERRPDDVAALIRRVAGAD